MRAPRRSTRQSVLEVFSQNAERIQKVVLDLIGRFPADLDALGARGGPRADARRRPRHLARGHPAVRDRPLRERRTGASRDRRFRPAACRSASCVRSIRAEPRWWLDSARRLLAAGYAGIWSWDHYMGRGDLTVPTVEAWTILSMAAGASERGTVGTFVANLMNRHPAVVARMAGTLQIASGGRFVLGIGIGGAAAGARGLRHAVPRGRRARGAPGGGRRRHPGAVDGRPGDPASRRSTRCTGRPRFRCRFRRHGSSSVARPATAPGWPARSAMAGRPSTTTSRRTSRPISRPLRGTAGRAPISWSSSASRATGSATRRSARRTWVRAPRAAWERWQGAGADGAIVLARTTDDVDALVSAVERW